MIRLWMNHWFSTAYNIIGLMREGNPDLHVIGTNEHEYSVVKNACDEWYREPVLKDDDYIDFCLNFCHEHQVDIFLPRRSMLKISQQKHRFEEAGVKVMTEEYAIMSILNQKQKAYEYFHENRIGIVPDYYVVTSVKEFTEAYESLLQKYRQVCFKFVRDEGGKSFRLIDNQRKGYTALFKKQNTRMTLDDVTDALSERETFAPLMVMPFLSGDEISVDCLDTKDGLIALPRVKGTENYETLRHDPDILEMCRDFQRKACLQQPYNIQFKYLDDTPYFLEVNTRMSGGIQMACLAGGINIPSIALKKMRGEDYCWHNDFRAGKVAQLLQPVLVTT